MSIQNHSLNNLDIFYKMQKTIKSTFRPKMDHFHE